ncbi:MAG: hypothetical protein HQM10_20315 [Candidatus Riflebacteria bacterium]|nr:hypothetical protein [Candidatus Riflebacteria bacterium]
MNMTLTLELRKEISIFILVNLLFSLLFLAPIQLKAGILSSVGSIAKGLVVTAGSIAGAVTGGVLGIAVGGGPIGMVLGGAGGYVISNKVMNWVTANAVNMSTTAGVIAGGALVIGMGAPLLIGGMVVGGLVGNAVGHLISKSSEDSVQTMASIPADDKDSQNFINHMLSGTSVAAPATPKEDNSAQVISDDGAKKNVSQSAYEKYISSYKAYIDAVQKGDDETAKKCYADYQKYYDAYQGSR